MGHYVPVPGLVAESIMIACRSSHADAAKCGAGIADEVQQIIADVLRAGPEEDLVQLQLEFVEQLSLPAIAVIFGIGVDEARRMRSRAMARLADALAG